MAILNEILKLLAQIGMQVSTDKSHFCQKSMEYLGFLLNRTGYKPHPLQVNAIMRIKTPKSVKQVCAFLGTINFIKNHIKQRSAICEPITRLTRKDAKFVWDIEQENAFNKVKAVISEAIMLEYPNPNCLFDIYPGVSSKYAMGAILEQDGKVFSTFSQKFYNAQLNYTIT